MTVPNLPSVLPGTAECAEATSAVTKAARTLRAARSHMFSGNTGPDSDMARLGRLAAQQARAEGLAEVEAEALFYSVHHRALILSLDDGEALIDAAVQRCDELGVPSGAWMLEVTRANLYLINRQYVQAIEIGSALLHAHGAQMGPLQQAALRHVLATSAKWSGRRGEMFEHAYLCKRAADEANHQRAKVAARANLASCLLGHAHDPLAALPLLDEARELSMSLVMSPSWLQIASMTIVALDVLGRHDEAYAVFTRDVMRPDARAWSGQTCVQTVVALIGVGRLDEAEAWLGEPPDLKPTDVHWARHFAYKQSKLRLLCAQGRYEQARSYALAVDRRFSGHAAGPHHAMGMNNSLREACAALGDADGAMRAGLEARRIGLSMARTASHARYLMTQLAAGGAADDFSATDLRRLQAIDETISAQQVQSPHGVAAAPPAGPGADDPQPQPAAEPAPQVPRFLAHVVHELRTPIGCVMGMADLLRMTELNDQQRRYVGLTHASAQSLLLLVNDVLDLAKIERGMFSLNVQRQNFPAWLRETVEPFVESARLRGIELHVRADERLPAEFMFDGLRLRQVLTNFMSNALKFTTKGEVRVQALRVDPQDAGRVGLRVEVRDTGCGIEPAALATLFREFVQAGPQVAHEFGGTGLGLAVSKQLVAHMGGRVGAQSVHGQGSLFWFELDLEPAHRDAASAAA